MSYKIIRILLKDGWTLTLEFGFTVGTFDLKLLKGVKIVVDTPDWSNINWGTAK